MYQDITYQSTNSETGKVASPKQCILPCLFLTMGATKHFTYNQECHPFELQEKR